jgi:NTP-dependent ternary system trypsin peptidase co-occuring protein
VVKTSAVIELAEVIRQLRTELDAARASAEDSQLRFELGPIELEVTVGLQKEGGGSAKVRFWVIELGGDAKATGSSTQRIKLTLQPTLSGASAEGETQVSVYVSGEKVTRER